MRVCVSNKGVRPSAVRLSPKKKPLPLNYHQITRQIQLNYDSNPRHPRDLTATSPRPVGTTTNEKIVNKKMKIAIIGNFGNVYFHTN